MYIHIAGFALQTLTKESVEKRTTVIAKGKSFVIVYGKSVGHVNIEPLRDLLENQNDVKLTWKKKKLLSHS